MLEAEDPTNRDYLVDFETDRKERIRLLERIGEIDIILAEIGFCVSDLGKIESSNDDPPIYWKRACVAIVLLAIDFQIIQVVGGIIIFFCLLNWVDRFEHSRKKNIHRLKIKEFELELAKIRKQLFGQWTRWQLDNTKLDLALHDAIEKDAVNFQKDSNGKLTSHFTFSVDPEQYLAYKKNFRLDQFVRPGLCELRFEGCIYPDTKSTSSFLKDPYTLAKLELHHGDHSTEYVVVSLSDNVKCYLLSAPSKSFPSGWPRLLKVFESTAQTRG